MVTAALISVAEATAGRTATEAAAAPSRAADFEAASSAAFCPTVTVAVAPAKPEKRGVRVIGVVYIKPLVPTAVLVMLDPGVPIPKPLTLPKPSVYTPSEPPTLDPAVAVVMSN